MRESIAIAVCWLTASGLILLSYFSALSHNPSAGPAPKAHEVEVSPSSKPPSAGADRGQLLFEQHKCHTCHSFKGRGNARHPLDGVGGRFTEEELRSWITGTGPAASLLPGAVKTRKAIYLKLSEAEMEEIIRYLNSSVVSTNQASGALQSSNERASLRTLPRLGHPRHFLQNSTVPEQEMQRMQSASML